MEGSLTWLSHQNCNDMFIYAKWNSSTTYGFGNNERDFGTDYGICCWYTPQLNFSAIPDGKRIQLLVFGWDYFLSLETLLLWHFKPSLVWTLLTFPQTLRIRKRRRRSRLLKERNLCSELSSLWASSKLPFPSSHVVISLTFYFSCAKYFFFCCPWAALFIP